MKIEKIKTDTGAHCNFCNRGEMMDRAPYPTLVYPYEHVFSFRKNQGNGVECQICEDCLMEFLPIINQRLNS